MTPAAKSICSSLTLHAAAVAVLWYVPGRVRDRFQASGKQDVISLQMSLASTATPTALAEEMTIHFEPIEPPIDSVQEPPTQEPSTLEMALDLEPKRRTPEPSEMTPQTPLPSELHAHPNATEWVQAKNEPTMPTVTPAVDAPRPKRKVKPAPPASDLVSAPAPPQVHDTKSADLSDNPAPPYPALAVSSRWEGLVKLRLFIAASGDVDRAELVASSGHAVLDRAALDAVVQWRGTPAERFGRPIASVEVLPIRFRL